MRFHIITLFPNSFDSYLGESILKRAIEDKKISVHFYNPRDFVDPENKFKHIDKPPYAGGPGMVIQAMPVIKAVEKALMMAGRFQKLDLRFKNKTKKKESKSHSKILNLKSKILLVWLTPSGKQFDTSYAKKSAKKYSDIIIICGRYEGIDARVKKAFKMQELSVGPFVLTGGELPAMILIDCMSRQVEGVLGNFDSREEERSGHQTASSDVYTRPEIFEWLNHFDKNGRPISKADLGKGKKYKVPKVLLSGDHKKIEEWRKSH